MHEAYHDWDCHNDYYGFVRAWRTDGVGFELELDGVYSEAIFEPYRQLPGWSLDDGTELYATPCVRGVGDVVLATTVDADGTLADRDYTFTLADGTTATWRVGADGVPVAVP